MAASIFGGNGGAVEVSAAGSIVPESFVATGGQTAFTLTKFIYTLNSSSLLVFVNGQLQTSGRDFTETSISTFALAEGCAAGDNVDVIGFPLVTLTGNFAGYNNGQLSGWRNKCINGGFEIWQRGTSFPSIPINTPTYTADRWTITWAGTAGSAGINLGNGYTAGTNAMLLVGVASNSYVDLRQRFEADDVEKWRGNTVTLSARIYNNTGATIIANSLVVLGSVPSAKDNWAGSTQVLVSTFTHAAILNATWGYVYYTFNPSAYAGIANGFDIGLRYQGLLAGQAINWAEIQLEVSPIPLPFDWKPAGTELVLCQRYYEKSYDQGIVPGTISPNGQETNYIVLSSGTIVNAQMAIKYKIPKRAGAAIVLNTYSPATGTIAKIRDAQNAIDLNATLDSGGENSFRLYYTQTANATTNVVAHWTSSAELV